MRKTNSRNRYRTQTNLASETRSDTSANAAEESEQHMGLSVRRKCTRDVSLSKGCAEICDSASYSPHRRDCFATFKGAFIAQILLKDTKREYETYRIVLRWRWIERAITHPK